MPNLDLDRQEYESDEAMDYLFDNQSKRLRTIMPAECVSFDANKNTVNVQPLLQRKINGVVENMPVITDVPVAFYGAGGMVITYQPALGDVCELWVNDRSITQWKINGGITDPGMGRHHHFTDAVAYFGINPFSAAYTNIKGGIDIRSRDGSTSLNIINGIVSLTIGGKDIAVMGQDGITFLVPVKVPDLQTNTIASVNAHVHGGVQSGGSNTGLPK